MSELARIAGQDWPQIEALLGDFDSVASHSPCDRNRLAKIAAQACPFELKYIAALNERRTQELPLQDLNLVTSVGMRIQPILLMLAILRPKAVVFVHTKESRSQAAEIQASPAWEDVFAGKSPFTRALKIDPTDTTNTYQQLASAVKQGKATNWVVDITGGQKVMGATLSAFAFWRHIPVVYLSSNETYGIPQPFSERLERIQNPYSTYGDPLLRAAEEAFAECHFGAAVAALQQLRETVCLVEMDHLASVASDIVTGYLLWDRFQHSNEDREVADRFYDAFERAKQAYSRFGYRFLDDAVFEGNCDFVRGLKAKYTPSKVALNDEYRLIDVLSNSARRAQQGFFDDAVARLYRATEMVATIMLRKFVPTFNPDKVDWRHLYHSFLKADLDKIYAAESAKLGYRVQTLPDREQLGVTQQLVLLATLAGALESKKKDCNPNQVAACKSARTIYDTYTKAVKSDNLFALRNRSILAHGTKPLDAELYKKFDGVVRNICRVAIGHKRFQELTRKARFPRLTFQR